MKIGLLAPITGELAPYGEALERGMTVGTELINEDGGIDGRQVEFELADDQTDPKPRPPRHDACFSRRTSTC